MTWRRVALLALCLALGGTVGFVGALLSGSQWWYVAVPGAIAAAWLVVADPERCMAGDCQCHGGGGSGS